MGARVAGELRVKLQSHGIRESCFQFSIPVRLQKLCLVHFLCTIAELLHSVGAVSIVRAVAEFLSLIGAFRRAPTARPSKQRGPLMLIKAIA